MSAMLQWLPIIAACSFHQLDAFVVLQYFKKLLYKTTAAIQLLPEVWMLVSVTCSRWLASASQFALADTA